MSRQIHDFISGEILEVSDLVETPGQGVSGVVKGKTIRIGSEKYVKGTNTHRGTAVFVSIDNRYLGFYRISNIYRKGLKNLVAYLAKRYRISL
ncbi:hypothetical protein RZS08_54165, partial [Arthrospira platensis SPKY1]|nr:hypothetical protein [Arthrospira platensis SPKY1]